MRQSKTPRWHYLLYLNKNYIVRAPFKLQSDTLHTPVLVAKKQGEKKEILLQRLKNKYE